MSQGSAGVKVTLKVINDVCSDIRIFKGIFTDLKQALKALLSFVSTSYKLDHFILSYIDDENDKVTIASVSDLQDGLLTAQNQKHLLRIHVNINPKSYTPLNIFEDIVESDEWYLPHSIKESKQLAKPMHNHDWPLIEPSKGAKNTVNAIRVIYDRLDMTKVAKDKEFISIAVGDPTKYPNLKPCYSVTQSVEKVVASQEWNGYGPSSGLISARNALVKKYSYPHFPNLNETDVFLASGCSGALDIAMGTLLNENDIILLPKPGFPLYTTICHRYGFKYKFYNCLAEKKWEIDLKHLESQILTQNGRKNIRIKGILINNPSNPCGSVLSKLNLIGILKLCLKYHLPIITDEIYNDMVFKGEKFISLASLTNNYKVPILTVGGIAKQYLVPGWRIGWIIVHDECNYFKQIKQGLLNLTTVLVGPNTIVQAALPNILFETPNEYYITLNQTLEKHATLLYNYYNNINGLKPIKPQGAMYLMTEIDISKFDGIIDDVDFANKLLQEEAILILPGSIFGAPNFFRSVVCAPPNIMNQVGKRMDEFCCRHGKKIVHSKL